MITSYAQLLSAIARWAGQSSDPAFPDAVADAVTLVEARINREVRAPEMLVRATAAVSSEFEALPDDTLKLMAVTLIDGDTEYPLRQVAPDRQAALRCQAARYSRPNWYSVHGLQVRFSPAPGAEMAMRVLYYGKVQPLLNATSCTAMLAAYPDLYLFGALSYLGEYIEDPDRLGRFEQRFQAAAAGATTLSVTRDGTLAA